MVKDKIEIYTISNMRKIATIDTECEPVTLPLFLQGDGTYALTPGPTSCYFAFTAGASGTIHVADLLKNTNEHEIAAHSSPVVQMTFNLKGTMLATASRNVSPPSKSRAR